MIAFNHVTKIYPGGTIALDCVDFRMEQSEFVLLTGANGAGKTTVMKLLYLDEHPDEGEIQIAFGGDSPYHSREGATSRRIQGLRRNLGIVFQDFKLLTDRDVFENVALALRVSNAPEAKVRNRVHEALELAGLSDKARRLPLQLSGGEQQRVAIARAMANDPYLLLADEPTGNLDPETSRDILRIFQNIHAAGTAVLMATHDEPLVSGLPYRRIRLDKGRMISES